MHAFDPAARPAKPPRKPSGRNDWLRQIPKVDLHCHLVGALRPETVADLARGHGIAFGKPVEALYDFSTFDDFIDMLRLAANVLQTRDDFARVAYELLEDGFRGSNLLHCEIMFNPQYHVASGISYRAMVDGLCDGIDQARADFGVSALLLACFDRQIEPDAARAIMEDIVAYRRDEVAGIGLDGPERAGPPASFSEVYAMAARAGLKRTAHVCEDNQALVDAPPGNYLICRDVLGCDRLDHGYNILFDDEILQQAVDDGLFFNVCTVTSAVRNRERRIDSIARMRQAGLRLTLNSDDPAMFKADMGDAYVRLFEALDWPLADARALAMAGIDASWLDEGARRDLRRRFADQFDALSQPG